MPPSLHELRTRYREQIVSLAALHHADKVRVFGSVARGDTHEGSDLDLLIHAAPGCSLLDICAIENEVSDLLGGVKVDVLSEAGIREELADFILNEAVLL